LAVAQLRATTAGRAYYKQRIDVCAALCSPPLLAPVVANSDRSRLTVQPLLLLLLMQN